MSAAARRSILVGSVGGQNFFPKIPEKFLVVERKFQENKYTLKMASAARRQIIGGGGAPINKRTKVGGGANKLSAAAARSGRSTALPVCLYVTFLSYPLNLEQSKRVENPYV